MNWNSFQSDFKVQCFTTVRESCCQMRRLRTCEGRGSLKPQSTGERLVREQPQALRPEGCGSPGDTRVWLNEVSLCVFGGDLVPSKMRKA